MRKLTALFLAMLLLLSLAACGDNGDGSSAPVSSEQGVSTPAGESTTTTAEDKPTTPAPAKSTTSSRDGASSTTTTGTKFVLPTSGDWEKPVTINTAVTIFDTESTVTVYVRICIRIVF